jgi:hypothetical protein
MIKSCKYLLDVAYLRSHGKLAAISVRNQSVLNGIRKKIIPPPPPPRGGCVATLSTDSNNHHEQGEKNFKNKATVLALLALLGKSYFNFSKSGLELNIFLIFLSLNIKLYRIWLLST